MATREIAMYPGNGKTFSENIEVCHVWNCDFCEERILKNMNENIFGDDCQLGIHHLYRDTLNEFKFLITEAPHEQ